MTCSTANCPSGKSPGHATHLVRLALIAIVGGLLLIGCGHAGKSGGSTRAVAPSTLPARDADDDNDNPAGTHYDSDDSLVLHYGQPASQADKRAIATAIRVYYLTAAAGDGKRACATIYSLLAETAAEDVSSSYPAHVPPCPAALSKYFRQNHREFAADAAKLTLVQARTLGANGLAFVQFGSRERRVLVHHEGGVWKVSTLHDMGVP